jgi:hypothetical protein
MKYAIYGVALAAAASLLVVMAVAFPPARILFDRLAAPAAVAAITVLASIGAGAIAENGDRGRPPLHSLLVGYPIAGTLLFLVGCVSTKLVPMLCSLLVLAAAGLYLTLRRPHDERPPTERLTTSAVICVMLLGAVVAYAFVIAQMPAFSLDELAYHLAVPKLWVLESHVVDLPLLSHSYFPLGTESADLPALSLLGDQGAISSHLVHLAIAVAASAAAFSWMRRRAGHDFSLVTLLAIVTAPVMLFTAGFSWNDWPLLGITIALLISVDDVVSREESSVPISVAIAAGMLTKYSYLAGAAAVMIAGLIAASTAVRARLLRAAAVGAAAGSVFLIRNLFLTGNPFAPMFGADAPPLQHFRRGGLSYIFDPGFADEALGVTMFVVAAVGLLALTIAPRERFRTALLIAATLSAVATIAAGPSSRIVVPSLAVAAAGAATVIFDSFEQRARTALAVVLIAAAAVQAIFAIAVSATLFRPFDVFFGKQSEIEYLSALRPYSGPQWVSSVLPPSSRTLVVGLNALFWFERPVRGGGNFDGARVSLFVGRGSPADFRQRLRAAGISHIAVFSEGVREQSESHLERQTLMSQTAVNNLREVLKTSKMLGAARGVEVWELR